MLIAVALALAILIYASIQDLKYREIDDKSFLALFLLGAALMAYSPSRYLVEKFLTSMLVLAAFTLILYKAKLIGGGDAKILLGLSAVFPMYPADTLSVFPFFTLSIFANAVFLTAAAPVFFLLYNLKKGNTARSRREIPMMFLGYRRKASMVRDFEAPVDTIRNLISPGKKLGRKSSSRKEVWVTPALPFVVSITAAFLISLLWGDVPSYLLVRLFK